MATDVFGRVAQLIDHAIEEEAEAEQREADGAGRQRAPAVTGDRSRAQAKARRGAGLRLRLGAPAGVAPPGARNGLGLGLAAGAPAGVAARRAERHGRAAWHKVCGRVRCGRGEHAARLALAGGPRGDQIGRALLVQARARALKGVGGGDGLGAAAGGLRREPGEVGVGVRMRVRARARVEARAKVWARARVGARGRGQEHLVSENIVASTRAVLAIIDHLPTPGG